jgi:hypothetical protein
MTKRRRTIEKPKGRGHIPMTDGKAVDVHYSLVVVQTVDDEVDTGHLVGQLEVRGTIEVDREQGMVDLGGQHFTLKTDDGRCLEAWTKKGDPATRQWDVVASGPKGLMPC